MFGSMHCVGTLQIRSFHLLSPSLWCLLPRGRGRLTLDPPWEGEKKTPQRESRVDGDSFRLSKLDLPQWNFDLEKDLDLTEICQPEQYWLGRIRVKSASITEALPPPLFFCLHFLVYPRG